MIKMVVFDMAGTTVDEDNVVYKTVRQAINEKGFDLTLEQVLANGAGKEKLQAIKSVMEVHLGNTDEELANAIFERFKVMLESAYNELQVKEQPAAKETFFALRKRGIHVVLNTGYQGSVAEGLVRKLGWVPGSDYDALITASDVTRNRPHPDMILLAMERFGISDPKTVIKVGDSTIDVEEGKNAGCGLSIGITTGAHTRGQLETASPDFIINSLGELLPVLGL
ncbi:phosphonatase-like hydrolase [uncultured Chitinophaga sp.]|uniref:phosphonatase-like hydrolase n=1 Tax=uncultured Chitinophaga sp. TaxID=339340 RepID=UPI0026009CCE|nr:phosphonatase-like hydrolase [uncultured Chitinophaga sp.]